MLFSYHPLLMALGPAGKKVGYWGRSLGTRHLSALAPCAPRRVCDMCAEPAKKQSKHGHCCAFAGRALARNAALNDGCDAAAGADEALLCAHQPDQKLDS